ncbi:MAG TPA: PEP/pyruvate-binding domain-containing protein [bacterium]
MLKGSRFSNIFGALALIVFIPVSLLWAQQPDFDELQRLAQEFKKDARGPYQAIRWFCPDGTVIPAQERCAQPGGIQHALPKDRVAQLAREHNIHLGQILAGTPFEAFLDSANVNSRMKQYQMEKFLQAVDDGWIVRRARFYRGAVQAEDEEAWGLNFLNWLLAKDDMIAQQYFLIRQLCKDIPHKAREDRWTTIRALAKTVADTVPSFLDLRIKIHGQPDPGDVQRVKEYRAQTDSIPARMGEMLQKLQKEMELAYQPANLQLLKAYIRDLSGDLPIVQPLQSFIQTYAAKNGMSNDHGDTLLSSKSKDLAQLIWNIRMSLPEVPASTRLGLIDLSNELEDLFFRDIANWQPQSARGLFEKSHALAQTAAGSGFLEIWEWRTIEPNLQIDSTALDLSYEAYLEKALYARRAVEWSTTMVRSVYEPVVELFTHFEPQAAGFVDDQVRSSALLPLGDVAWKLAEIAESVSTVSNNVMGIPSQNQMHGLNPGFACGELEVISEAPEGMSFSASKIYIVQRAPADLKPVAGIATVSEGNLVSHVQLLARNLGIPNAAITQQNLKELLPFAGQKVFYAVSRNGAVIIKPDSAMTAEERALVEVSRRNEERIAVPTKKINLKEIDLINMRNLRATDSGKTCGPKAANLGQLKHMFPENVVEGFAIPFGIFWQHLQQAMSGSNGTYWQFLQETFAKADSVRQAGAGEGEVEAFTLERLGQLAAAIKKMAFLDNFMEKLEKGFMEILGANLGEIPVFIRSDTNMEDLKDFTGAGLNLTVFNVVDKEKFLQGIRDVWASPYSERSYRWRQKFLLNPENVYPSILILPSVNVDKSGVMITTDVQTGNPLDITVAFNRGVGGAVEGQKAESYLLRQDGQNLLQTPARENKYTLIPPTGGTQKGFAPFNRPILAEGDLFQLRKLADLINTTLKKQPGIESQGPWDVELGFKDGNIWLFQVRPFVENKRAASSQYLRTLDPLPPTGVRIELDKAIVMAN